MVSDLLNTSPHKLLKKIVVWSKSRSGFKTWRCMTWSGDLRSGTPDCKSSMTGKRYSNGKDEVDSKAESDDKARETFSPSK